MCSIITKRRSWFHRKELRWVLRKEISRVYSPCPKEFSPRHGSTRETTSIEGLLSLWNKQSIPKHDLNNQRDFRPWYTPESPSTIPNWNPFPPTEEGPHLRSDEQRDSRTPSLQKFESSSVPVRSTFVYTRQLPQRKTLYAHTAGIPSKTTANPCRRSLRLASPEPKQIEKKEQKQLLELICIWTLRIQRWGMTNQQACWSASRGSRGCSAEGSGDRLPYQQEWCPM